MVLSFNFKHKDYEIRSCPRRLARFSGDEVDETIDFVKWERDGEKQYCFSLAYFERYGEGYRLKFVGDRPFEYIEKEDLPTIWSVLKSAQEILDKFFESENEV